jgi:hypothetical protein
MTSTSPSIILSHSPVNLSTCPSTIFRLFLGYFSSILRLFFQPRKAHSWIILAPPTPAPKHTPCSTILRLSFDYPSTILRPFCSCHQTRNATRGHFHTTRACLQARACQTRTCCENHNDDYQEGCGHHIISAILQPFFDHFWTIFLLFFGHSSSYSLAILWLFFQPWTQRAKTAPSKSTTTKATVTKPAGQGKCGPRGHQEEGSRSHSQTRSRRHCQGHCHQKDAGE